MKKKQILFFILDIFIVLAAFIIAAVFKPATRRFYIPKYIDKVVVLTIFWIVISLAGNKYKIPYQKRFSDILANLFRNNFVILGLVTFVLFAFKAYQYSRLIVFGTLFITFFLEFILSVIFFFHTKLTKNSDFCEELDHKPKDLKTISSFPSSEINFERFKSLKKENAYQVLKNNYLQDYKKIFLWLESCLPLKGISKENVQSINSANIYNVKKFENNSLDMFINLHYVNDFQRINKFFIEINNNLKYDGIFVGRSITNKEVYKNFIKKYGVFLGKFLYVFHFIFNRVIPKLEGFKEIYFAITKGKNRALSKAEILGRLYFCGFSVYEINEIDGIFHFIAVKKGLPKEDKNPSYGPLFKMKRVGKDMKTIYVYKFRTMHPYSEYLQHYLVEHNGYDEKGKIKNDFRITVWGRLLRKYWLDELPQLINVLKGDMTLVGVRPLSERFFWEYPKEIREKRIKYKPGCIPPYVALNKQSKEKSMDAEIIYLNEKEKHPFWTDIKYFFMAIYNIFTGKIRSK